MEHERTGFLHRTPIRRSLNRLALPNSFKNRIAKPMVHADGFATEQSPGRRFP